MFLIAVLLIGAAAMDLVTQVLLLFTGFTVTSQSLPDDPTTTPDPGVFEMQTPPGFMRFFPMKDDISGNPVKFHFWSSPVDHEEVMKFPDWFHYIDTKPEDDIKVDKNADKDDPEGMKKPETNYMNWQDETHNMFSYTSSPSKDKLDANSVFPPYYNVFLSNAYPNWMSMPGLYNSPDVEKKDGRDEKFNGKNIIVVSEPEKKVSDIPLSEDKIMLLEKEKVKINEDMKVEKLSELSPHNDENLKISKNIRNIKDDVKINEDTGPVIFPNANDDRKVIEETLPEISKDAKEDFSLASKDSIVPAEVITKGLSNPQSLNKIDNLMIVPLSIEPNQDTINTEAPIIIPHSSEEKLDSVAASDNTNLDTKVSNVDQDKNWKDFLYNLLQNAKPMFASLSSDTKDSLTNKPKLAAMLIPLKDNPKTRSRSIISGNNVVINNDNIPNVDHTVHATPSPNPQDSQNNAALSNLAQNSPNNHGNSPNNVLNLVNRNPGNVPVNPSNYSPYGNNYLPNSGLPVLVNFPANSNGVPMNLVMANGSPMNTQGLQPNQMSSNVSPGTYSSSNNLALPPGWNNGQNLFAIVPISSGNIGNVNAAPPFTNANGNVGNSAPNLYLSNPQMNPGYQVVNSVPVYNLVPANNVVLNTKDEAD